VFNDRITFRKVRKKARAYIEAVKWADAARGKVTPLAPTKITKIQGSLYGEHVTAEYLALFNEECIQLKAPSFVQITQKNVRGSTLRKLEIAKQKAAKVLSEGEQRAIAIADFVTEARLNPHNRGVVFDDPVSSQDHARRERIAARLVELAKVKQVVVFTHDIVFFIRLKAIAMEQQVELDVTTVRNVLDIPGIINPDLPLQAQPVAKRVRWLRDRLVMLKKLEKDGEQDQYHAEVKLWYGLLREGWERAVEELLFNNVIQRYDPRVQTRRLKDLKISEDLIADVTKAMTNTSSWVHDSGAAMNPTPPDSKEAENDLGLLDNFVKKFRAA
jgi:energy-coupling factor transporter ATP-binding protein EcfA2